VRLAKEGIARALHSFTNRLSVGWIGTNASKGCGALCDGLRRLGLPFWVRHRSQLYGRYCAN